MGKDDGLKEFFSDDERYADVVNGLGFQGRQVVRKEDLEWTENLTSIAGFSGYTR